MKERFYYGNGSIPAGRIFIIGNGLLHQSSARDRIVRLSRLFRQQSAHFGQSLSLSEPH